MAGEKRFEKQVERYLESKHIYHNTTRKQDKVLPERGWFFKVWGGGYQSAGVPDIIANVNGYFLAIELKDVNGKPSALQKRNVELINQTNGVAVILYPQGFEQFKEIIEVMLACNSAIPGHLPMRGIRLSTSSGILRD